MACFVFKTIELRWNENIHTICNKFKVSVHPKVTFLLWTKKGQQALVESDISQYLLINAFSVADLRSHTVSCKQTSPMTPVFHNLK